MASYLHNRMPPDLKWFISSTCAADCLCCLTKISISLSLYWGRFWKDVLLSYEICATGWLALTKGWQQRHHPSSHNKLALIEGGRHNYRQTHFVIRIMHTQTIRFGKIIHYARKNIQKLKFILAWNCCSKLNIKHAFFLLDQVCKNPTIRN